MSGGNGALPAAHGRCGRAPAVSKKGRKNRCAWRTRASLAVRGLNYYGMHRGCELNSIGKGGGRPWHSAPAHAHSKASERGRGRGSE
jgi:hypothetical protein